MEFYKIENPTTQQIQVLDICYPDYFSGYHKTVLRVEVYSKQMTCIEIANELKSEIDNLFEMMEETHTKAELSIWDQYIKELTSKGDDIFYSDETPEEAEGWISIFFGLTNPVIVNGINFLNT